MEPEREIQDVLHRCARGFDDDDIDLLARCFTVDGELVSSEGAIRGRDEIRAAMRERQLLRFADGRRPRHLITNVEIELRSPDAAAARASYTLLSARADGVAIASTGTYADELVREGGEWRIRRREVTVLGAAPPS